MMNWAYLEKIQKIAKDDSCRLVFRNGEQTLSYGELWDRSGRLAAYLSARFDRQQPCVVYGGKDTRMLVSFLACIRSGRAYIPVDEIVPADRIAQIVKASGAVAFINTTVLGLHVFDADVLLLDRTSLDAVLSTSVGLPDLDPALAVQADEVFYVIFTSGSTGMPKGVQITRRNLEDFAEWTMGAYEYERKQHVFLNRAPFSFDLSVYELQNALVSGGSMLGVGHEQLKDLRTLWAYLSTYGRNISVWVSTPSFLGLCVSIPEFKKENFPEMYQFVLIGEVFPKSLAREVISRFPNTIVSNFYGPTEATVAHTVIDLDSSIIDRHELLPIGYCKPGSKVIIENGEIVLAGPNVSPGYLNDSERTAKVFFERDGVRHYRTGDLGHLDESGLLFFGGRSDHQVKLNGYRIELGDIENNLLKLTYVTSACVLPIEVEGKIQSLCGFVVLAEELKSLSQLELRKKIRKDLADVIPAYMIPRNFLAVAHMPMTGNGKIDRKQLRLMLGDL